MLNVTSFNDMKKKGKYDLPLLLSYKNGTQISKWLKDSGLDLSSLKPYNALSEVELKRIVEKAEVPNSKKEEMEQIASLLEGKVIEVVEVKTETKAKTSTVKKDKSVGCGGNCTCGTSDSEKDMIIENQKKLIAKLEKDVKALEIVAKITNKEEFEQMKISQEENV